jgi:hypothetical protein
MRMSNKYYSSLFYILYTLSLHTVLSIHQLIILSKMITLIFPPVSVVRFYHYTSHREETIGLFSGTVPNVRMCRYSVDTVPYTYHVANALACSALGGRFCATTSTVFQRLVSRIDSVLGTEGRKLVCVGIAGIYFGP